MKFYKEMPLSKFDFWGGAKQRTELLTSEELDKIDDYLEEISADQSPYTETEINDMFWFDFDTFSELLGFTEEELFENRNLNQYGELQIKEDSHVRG